METYRFNSFQVNMIFRLGITFEFLLGLRVARNLKWWLSSEVGIKWSDRLSFDRIQSLFNHSLNFYLVSIDD